MHEELRAKLKAAGAKALHLRVILAAIKGMRAAGSSRGDGGCDGNVDGSDDDSGDGSRGTVDRQVWAPTAHPCLNFY